MHFVDEINDCNIFFFMFFICILILMVMYYVIKNNTNNDKLKEGFSLKDIGKVAKSVKKIGTVATSLGTQVTALQKNVSSGLQKMEEKTTNAVNQIDDKLAKFKDTIVKETNDLVVNKIKGVFEGLGKVLYDGIIKPLRALFVGIGDTFVQLFDILKKIGYKITSLPTCIIYFLINSTIGSINGFFSSITPNFIEKPIVAIWNATFGKLINWFLDLVGYNAASNKCYGFNVNEQIDNINANFKQIGDSFSKDFGKLDFSKIAV